MGRPRRAPYGNAKPDAPSIRSNEVGAVSASAATSANATERTPLNQAVLLRTEFEAMLHEVDPETGETMMSLLLKRPGTMLIVIILFGFLFLLGTDQIGPPNLMQELRPAMDIDVAKVELAEVTESEIRVNVNAAIEFCYDRINSGLYSWAAETLGGLVNEVDVSFRDGTDLLVKYNDSQNHLAYLKVDQPLKMNLTRGVVNHLKVPVVINGIGGPEVIAAILSSFNEKTRLELFVLCVLVLEKGSISVPFQVKIPFSIRPSKKFRLDSFDVESVSIDASPEVGMDTTVQFSAHYEFPIVGSFPGTDWFVNSWDCNHKELLSLVPIRIGEFKVRAPRGKMSFEVSTRLKELPRHFNDTCGPGDTTLLDMWLKAYMSGESLHFIAKGDSDHAKKSILHNALAGVDLPVDIAGREQRDISIDSVSINDAKFESIPGIGSKRNTLLSGNLTLESDTPSYLHVQDSSVISVEQIRGAVHLFYEEGRFGTFILTDWTPTKTCLNGTQFVLRSYLNKVPFQVENEHRFSKVVEKLLFFREATIHYEAYLDIAVQTTIGGVELTDTHFAGDTCFRR